MYLSEYFMKVPNVVVPTGPVVDGGADVEAVVPVVPVVTVVPVVVWVVEAAQII